MGRKSCLSLLCLLLGVAAPATATATATAAAAGKVEIVRIWTGYKQTSAFVRLREFITGHESSGKAFVLRSDPDSRDGFYYTVRLAHRERGGLPPAEIVLSVVPPDAAAAKTYRFSFEGTKKKQARLDIGLTGGDWTYGKTLPIAWRLEVMGKDGHVLASGQSFLWSDNTTESPSE